MKEKGNKVIWRTFSSFNTNREEVKTLKKESYFFGKILQRAQHYDEEICFLTLFQVRPMGFFSFWQQKKSLAVSDPIIDQF